MSSDNDQSYALSQDRQDPLGEFRNEFIIPKKKGKEVIYFCGNSLGLQPVKASQMIEQVLEAWSHLGVDGHFEGQEPWMTYHRSISGQMAQLVGAKKEECTLMHSLTANIHALLFSFYQPDHKRYKIIAEADIFPSDRYALESHVRLHQLPQDAIHYIAPSPGEHLITDNQIEDAIEEVGDKLALVWLGVTNYYTGQKYNVREIAKLTHQQGGLIGLDMAHGVGNIPFELHADEIDIACWCTYKYLNGGPGSLSGLYIHQSHMTDENRLRMAGWWGQKMESRFDMRQDFDPIPSAEGWQSGNQPIVAQAALKASLDLFEQAGLSRLRAKSLRLTGYLESLIADIDKIEIITPKEPSQRGCQLSLLIPAHSEDIYQKLLANNIIVDWRKPDVIRIAPTPLYNTYMDVYRCAKVIRKIFAM